MHTCNPSTQETEASRLEVLVQWGDSSENLCGERVREKQIERQRETDTQRDRHVDTWSYNPFQGHDLMNYMFH
jgi:hypothetical protein